MFKKGIKPCAVVPSSAVRALRRDLRAAGYQVHEGPRTTRAGEIRAWLRLLGEGRQVHVQEVALEGGDVALFAHTEPEGWGLRHLVAAVLDQVSFQAGARVLKRDLRAMGWDLGA